MKLQSKIIKGFVFVNGYGLVKFKVTDIYKYVDGITPTQYKGMIKLPNNVTT